MPDEILAIDVDSDLFDFQTIDVVTEQVDTQFDFDSFFDSDTIVFDDTDYSDQVDDGVPTSDDPDGDGREYREDDGTTDAGWTGWHHNGTDDIGDGTSIFGIVYDPTDVLSHETGADDSGDFIL